MQDVLIDNDWNWYAGHGVHGVLALPSKSALPGAQAWHDEFAPPVE
jgi:hypothetical protein